jgi:hypothetical protein
LAVCRHGNNLLPSGNGGSTPGLVALLTVDGEDYDRKADREIQPRNLARDPLECAAPVGEGSGLFRVLGSLLRFGQVYELPSEVGPMRSHQTEEYQQQRVFSIKGALPSFGDAK